jgi:hypothetical protein
MNTDEPKTVSATTEVKKTVEAPKAAKKAGNTSRDKLIADLKGKTRKDIQAQYPIDMKHAQSSAFNQADK